MLVRIEFLSLVVVASSFLTGCVGVTLGAMAIHDAPDFHEGPKATEPHAEVTLDRKFGSIPRDRVDQSSKIGSQLVRESERVVRLAPGRARWTFATNVNDSAVPASGPPIAHLRHAPVASCNLTKEFGFDAGRKYRVTYSFEGNNKCELTCIDTTETTDGTPCK